MSIYHLGNPDRPPETRIVSKKITISPHRPTKVDFWRMSSDSSVLHSAGNPVPEMTMTSRTTGLPVMDSRPRNSSI